jgi:hypothetical protein
MTCWQGYGKMELTHWDLMQSFWQNISNNIKMFIHFGLTNLTLEMSHPFYFLFFFQKNILHTEFIKSQKRIKNSGSHYPSYNRLSNKHA